MGLLPIFFQIPMNRASLHKSRSGSGMVLVLVSVGIVSTALYFMTDAVLRQKRQTQSTANLTRVHLALHSVLDFALFGVRQKHCFTSTLLADSTCTLTHEGSVERLILSVGQENHIRELMSAVPPVNTGLALADLDKVPLHRTSLTLQFAFSDISPLHPLYEVLRPIAQGSIFRKGPMDADSATFSQVKVEIKRDSSSFLPMAGNEVYLGTIVSFLDEDGDVLKLGSIPMIVNSRIAIYPREVGSFALLTPNDLHLDTSWDAKLGTGDVAFHKFNDRPFWTGKRGLVFSSPVFVNGDVHLADEGPIPEASKVYTPVTFAEKVFLGNGSVRMNGDPFKPRFPGSSGNERWSEISSFGGFLKGLENDTGFDKGLQVLAGIVPKKIPDVVDMKKCIELTNALTDMTNLAKSKSNAVLKEKIDNKYYKYRLFLSQQNQLNPQGKEFPDPSVDDFGKGEIKHTKVSKKDQAIISLGITLGDKYASSQMSMNGTLEILPEFSSDEYNALIAKNLTDAKADHKNAIDNKKSLEEILAVWKDLQVKEKELDAKKDDLKKKNDAYDAVKTVIDDNTKKLNADKDDLETELKKEPKDQDDKLIDKLNQEIKSLEDDLPNLEKKRDDLEKSVDAIKLEIPPLELEVKALDDERIAKQVKIGNTDKSLDDLNKTIEKAEDEVKVAEDKSTEAQAAFNNLAYILEHPPKITVVAEAAGADAVFIDYNKLNLKINFENPKSLIDSKGDLTDPHFDIWTYDATFYRGYSILDKDKRTDQLHGYLNFSFDKDRNLKSPGKLSVKIDKEDFRSTEEDPIDYGIMMKKCSAARSALSSQSFGGASWDEDFSPGTRSSWNFADIDPDGMKAGEIPATLGKDPVLDKIIFDSGNALPGLVKFQVRSIVGECIIKDSAEFVTGFFNCDKLTIQSRIKPLRIIGTFIVSSLSIHPDAFKAGIEWSSIYHPQSTPELRQAGVLASLSPAQKCSDLNIPIWHPSPSLRKVSDRMTCNVISLRSKANPFQWTSVDPDCGVVDANTNTTCKRRLIKFLVVEVARGGGL